MSNEDTRVVRRSSLTIRAIAEQPEPELEDLIPAEPSNERFLAAFSRWAEALLLAKLETV
jgi:hypothetical protein